MTSSLIHSQFLIRSIHLYFSSDSHTILYSHSLRERSTMTKSLYCLISLDQSFCFAAPGHESFKQIKVTTRKRSKKAVRCNQSIIDCDYRIPEVEGHRRQQFKLQFRGGNTVSHSHYNVIHSSTINQLRYCIQ